MFNRIKTLYSKINSQPVRRYIIRVLFEQSEHSDQHRAAALQQDSGGLPAHLLFGSMQVLLLDFISVISFGNSEGTEIISLPKYLL